MTLNIIKMAFKPIGSLLGGANSGAVRSYIGDNSGVFQRHDAVTLEAGAFVVLGTTGVRLLGVVLGAVDAAGHPASHTSGSTTTWTMTSDNETVAARRLLVQISPFQLYSGDPDATIGTTTGSNQSGYVSDIVDEDEIDESTAALASTTTNSAQLHLWGVDPNDSGNAICNIFESLFRGN